MSEEKDKKDKREDTGKYKNPNGNYTTEEFIELVNNGEFEEYTRNFKSTTSKCPPSIWCINSDCFYCQACHLDSYERVITMKE